MAHNPSSSNSSSASPSQPDSPSAYEYRIERLPTTSVFRSGDNDAQINNRNFIKPLLESPSSLDQDGDAINLVSRLKQIYPYADHSELPLSWSPKDKSSQINLSENNLRIYFKGNGKKDKNDKQAASARATHPIPQSCQLYYFEISIISKGREGYMGIGLSGNNFSLCKLPGWVEKSYGYHGDDGHAFHGEGTGKKYGPTFATGDIIGCGYNLIDQTCFYTKNGLNLGVAFTNLPNEPLYPTVGLKTPGEEVEANFGQRPFCYNIEQDIKSMRQNILAKLEKFDVNYNEYRQIEHKLIQSWLIHNSYPGTAEAFSKAAKLDFKENIACIQQRLQIQQLILAGKISEAIKTTNRLCPQLLQYNPNLLFALKCRQFIEMINGNETDDQPTIEYNFDFKPSRCSHNLSDSNGDISNAVRQYNGSCNGSSYTVNTSQDLMDIDHPNSNCNNNINISVDNNTAMIVSDSTDFESANDEERRSASIRKTDESKNGKSHTNVSDQNGHQSENNGNSNLNGTGGDCILLQDAKLPRLLSFGRELYKFSLKLKRQYGKNETNKQMIMNAFSLIAYSDPKDSPMSWLLDSSEREALSQLLNSAIVKAEHGSSNHEPPLEKCVKHLKILLKSNAFYGKWLFEKML